MSAAGSSTATFTGILGGAVLAAAVVALTVAPPPAEAGDLPVPRPVTASSPGPEGPERPAGASTSPRDEPLSEPLSRGAADDLAVAPPVRVSLPSLGVEAEVAEVGLEPDGAMEVPGRVEQVGWYELGPAPGEPGSAVIAGHVDARGQGPGAFWDLHTLAPGDTFALEHGDGTTTTWRVAARRVHDKGDLPIDELFTREGPPRLALVTCGGAFDASAGSYEDNVVVYAEPLTGDGRV